MSSRWLLVLLLVPLFSSIAFSQKLINGFTREFAIHGLPTGFSLKSFDVTGDSVSELFVLTGSQLWVFDGKTFSMILKDSVAPGTANLSPADVNRDSNMDLVATRSNSEVLVWYGPDFHNRSSYTAPRGFGVFGVRNRNDGQVEFSFGIGHEHSYQYPGEFCPEYWNDGHLYRYLDTTFVFMDSANLPGTPVGMVPYYALGFNELFPLQYGYRDHNCMPNYFSRSYSLARIGNQVTSGPLFYSYSCFGCGVRCGRVW